MFRAMLHKELREVVGIALLGLAAYAALVAVAENPGWPISWMLYNRYEHVPHVPFVNGNFIVYYILISGALAIGLGLRQTVGESVRGTYPFLFHRPASRRWLAGMKLLAGAIAYFICAALPILIHGLWAARPGTHPSPFEWSMTLMYWEIWFGMILLYLGAFLSGIRPGRWFGSRLLPLAAACFAVPTIMFPLDLSPWLPVALVAADAIAVISILFVARTRDF